LPSQHPKEKTLKNEYEQQKESVENLNSGLSSVVAIGYTMKFALTRVWSVVNIL
jgi:hypothetical protein